MTAREQRRMGRRRGPRRVRRFTSRTWFTLGGIGIAIVAVVGALIVMFGGGEGSGGYPQEGDHWHADYTITVCGETVPDFGMTPGGIHTHGKGVVHLHPTRPEEAGPSANMARFMAGAGGRLTDTSLRLPFGDEYNNGDPCPDGDSGQVFLRVNGIPSVNIASYVPRDGESVEFGFEPQ
jgi:hypothetical protein